MNILFDRNSSPGFAPQEGLSRLQAQVDGAVGGFLKHATDWRSLAAMTAGGMAYRLGRIGVLGLGGSSNIRVASLALGLAAEISTFELTHRGLSTGSHLWKWSGHGGLAQGLLHSFITFGTLKGAGRLARRQNFLVQHLLQDSAMVAGHQASAILGVAPRPEGTLAEQFLQAEATNLSLGAGMALAHGLTPGVSALERGFQLTTTEISLPRRNLLFERIGKTPLRMAPLSLALSGCEFADRAGESFRSADPSDRLLWGILLSTGVVGLYRLSIWWFEKTIDNAYHGLRPGEALLNARRMLEDSRKTRYRPVNLDEIRSALLVANAIFADAKNLEAVSPRILLDSHRIFDLFFDPKSGDLKEAFELMRPQPYYPPPEPDSSGLLHARIGRLIDLNQFADLAGEPLLGLNLVLSEPGFRLNDYQLAFRGSALMPRASRKLALPYEGDLSRLVAGPDYTPMGPISIEKESDRYFLRGAELGEDLVEDLPPRYLTRNRRGVIHEGTALRPLDVIGYDGLALRWIPPRRGQILEKYDPSPRGEED